MLDFTHRVLAAIADADCHDALWWRCDGGYAPFTPFINCSDTFDFGTADVVQVDVSNVLLLEQTLAEVRRVTGGDTAYGPALFCARVRRQRPMGLAYPTDSRLWPLFDACGEDRGDAPGRRPRSLRDALQARRERDRGVAALAPVVPAVQVVEAGPVGGDWPEWSTASSTSVDTPGSSGAPAEPTGAPGDG